MSTHWRTNFILVWRALDIETGKNIIVDSLSSIAIKELFEQFYFVDFVGVLHLFE